jgi:hypothetical protein
VLGASALEFRAPKSEIRIPTLLLGASMPRLGASMPEPGASKSRICAPLDGTQAPMTYRRTGNRRLGFAAAVVRPLTVPSAPSTLVVFAPRAAGRMGQVALSRDEIEEVADKFTGKHMGSVSRVPATAHSRPPTAVGGPPFARIGGHCPPFPSAEVFRMGFSQGPCTT